MSRGESLITNSREKSFSVRFKEIFKNLPNKEIARLLKVSEPAITSYIKGRIPPAEKLIAISKITNCNIHWLLTGTGEKTINSPSTHNPTTLVFQGYRNGVGTTMSSIMTAVILADRGFRVLLVDNENGDCSNITENDRPFPENIFLTKRKPAKCNFFSKMLIANLELFVNKGYKYAGSIQKSDSLQSRTISEIKNEYDFIICDASFNENFLWNVNFFLSDFTKESHIIFPYQPHDVIDYREKFLNDLPDLIGRETEPGQHPGIMGAFMFRRFVSEEQDSLYRKYFKEIESVIHERMFKTTIKEDPSSPEKHYIIRENKSRQRSALYANYSLLVDEIISRLEK